MASRLPADLFIVDELAPLELLRGQGWANALDALLGMEGNDVRTELWEQSNGAYANISGNLGYLDQLSKTNTLIEVPMPNEMLPTDFQKVVLVISP